MEPRTSPSRDDVESKLLAVTNGTQTRGDVDRWAAQWVGADDSKIEDSVVWWGLLRLFGVDSRLAPDGPFLHDDEQVADWLKEYRDLRSGNLDVHADKRLTLEDLRTRTDVHVSVSVLGDSVALEVARARATIRTVVSPEDAIRLSRALGEVGHKAQRLHSEESGC